MNNDPFESEDYYEMLRVMRHYIEEDKEIMEDVKRLTSKIAVKYASEMKLIENAENGTETRYPEL